MDAGIVSSEQEPTTAHGDNAPMVLDPIVRELAATPDEVATALADTMPPSRTEAKERAPTGLGGLDIPLGGGLPWGSTTLVLSHASRAPRLLAARFAANGLEEGQDVYYLTTDEPAERLRARLAPGPEAGVGTLHVVDAHGLRLAGLGPTGLGVLSLEGEARDPVRAFLDAILEAPADRPFRIVVGSLTGLVDAYGERAALDLVRALGVVARSVRCAAIVELEKGVHDARLEARAAYMTDALLEFGVERHGFGLYPFLAISKMPGAPQVPVLVLYRERDDALWFESVRRVF